MPSKTRSAACKSEWSPRLLVRRAAPWTQRSSYQCTARPSPWHVDAESACTYRDEAILGLAVKGIKDGADDLWRHALSCHHLRRWEALATDGITHRTHASYVQAYVLAQTRRNVQSSSSHREHSTQWSLTWERCRGMLRSRHPQQHLQQRPPQVQHLQLPGDPCPRLL